MLSVEYETRGEDFGPVVVLIHDFPYHVRAYDAVAEIISASGARVIAPHLRGFGRTRFIEDRTVRSGPRALPLRCSGNA